MEKLKLLDNYFIIFFITFAIYFAFVLYLHFKKKGINKVFFISLIFFAMIIRIILFSTTPLLSDDVYRYYFDGKVLANGINPFKYPPNSPELDFLQDNLSKQINHPHMHTVYPPFAQILFLLGYSLNMGIYGIKLIFAFFDLGTVFLIYLILKKTNKNKSNLFIYALNPLVIIEFYTSVHLEPVLSFFTCLAIYLLCSGRKFTSYLSIGFAFLTKFLSLFVFPFFIKKIKFKLLILGAIIIILPFLFFLNTNLFTSLKIYMGHFYFNSPVFEFMKMFYDNNEARLFCFILFIFSYFLLIINEIFFKNEKEFNVDRFVSFILYSFCIYLFTTPTFHPWYFTLVIPLLCLNKKFSLILFSGLIFLSYSVLYSYFSQSVWKLNPIYLILQYVSLIIFLLLEKFFKNKIHNFPPGA